MFRKLFFDQESEDNHQENNPFILDELFPCDPERIIYEASLGILMGLVNYPIAYLLAYLEIMLLDILELKQQSPFDINELLNPFFIFKLCIVSPLVEEIIHRGAIIPAIKYCMQQLNINESYAKYLAVFGSSLEFSYRHVRGSNLTSFFSGLTYGFSTMNNEGSLWQSIMAHITTNSVAAIKLLTRA